MAGHWQKWPLLSSKNISYPQRDSPLNTWRRSKNAMFWWAGKVPHSSHWSIILTTWLVEFNAQPESCIDRKTLAPLIQNHFKWRKRSTLNKGLNSWVMLVTANIRCVSWITKLYKKKEHSSKSFQNGVRLLEKGLSCYIQWYTKLSDFTVFIKTAVKISLSFGLVPTTQCSINILLWITPFFTASK